jgi:calcineurin-like phosphoesterase family protein
LKTKYLVIDAETGKELNGKTYHNLEIRAVPQFKNASIHEDSTVTWNEVIEQQRMIYHLSDIDWKTIEPETLRKIANMLLFSGTINECK